MDVRAYSEVIKEPLDTSLPANVARQLKPLRIERLAPAVLFALFDGEPKLVILEEPYHGVQFGIRADASPQFRAVRDATGNQLIQANRADSPVDVPMRFNSQRVVRVAACATRSRRSGPPIPPPSTRPAAPPSPSPSSTRRGASASKAP